MEAQELNLKLGKSVVCFKVDAASRRVETGIESCIVRGETPRLLGVQI